MSNPETKKSKDEKDSDSPHGNPDLRDQSSEAVVDSVHRKPIDLTQTGVTLVSQEKFQEKVQALRDLTMIRNDRDEDVPFEGDLKELFIDTFEEAYPVIEQALSSLYELGGFLYEVRDRLKPHKLYYSWLNYAGIPERTAANYVQVFDRYAGELPRFAHLGIKKLITASRLPDCVKYVADHEQSIATQSAKELEQAVKAMRSAKKGKRAESARGRRPTYISVGKSKIRPSQDGTRLIIEGLTKKKQSELIEVIKGLLS